MATSAGYLTDYARKENYWTKDQWVNDNALAASSGVLSDYALESWVTERSYGSAAAVALNTAKTSFPGFGMTRVEGGGFQYGVASTPKTLPTFYVDIYQVTAGEDKECVEAGGGVMARRVQNMVITKPYI